jgi:hypothetical protein
MRTTYPEDYTGPKAGGSDDKEWLDISEYQAFCWVQARRGLIKMRTTYPEDYTGPKAGGSDNKNG